jgi:hypothetical protein
MALPTLGLGSKKVTSRAGGGANSPRTARKRGRREKKDFAPIFLRGDLAHFGAKALG